MARGRQECPAERDVELALLRLGWRLDALDDWRKGIDRFCSTTSTTLGEMSRAEEIANAVADRMTTAHTLHLTWLQRSAAIIVGVATLAASAKVLIGA